MPAYAWFDSKTGTLTFPAHQPIWNWSAKYDAGIVNVTAGVDEDIVMLYGDDKTLHIENAQHIRVAAYTPGTTNYLGVFNYYWYGNSSDDHILFQKQEEASAPALTPVVATTPLVNKNVKLNSEKCHVASGKVANAPAAR